MHKTTFITVRFQKEGIHRYPAAETDPALKDVAFLASPHRHMFHFNVEIEVFHNDRELEFILVKRELEGLYGTKMEIDFKSCEMLANDLVDYIIGRWGNFRYIRVGVFEDGENGGVVVWDNT